MGLRLWYRDQSWNDDVACDECEVPRLWMYDSGRGLAGGLYQRRIIIMDGDMCIT